MKRLATLLLIAVTATASADELPLENTRPFEHAYAASYYQFDACGDGLAGRAYRIALSEKVKSCNFSPDAKKRFVERAAAQRGLSSKAMAKLIDDHGGLPVKLDGMTQTCREQRETPAYQELRSRLESFVKTKRDVDTVVTQPCDAPEITP